MLPEDDVAVQSFAVAARSIIRHRQPIRSSAIPNRHRQSIAIINHHCIGMQNARNVLIGSFANEPEHEHPLHLLIVDLGVGIF